MAAPAGAGPGAAAAQYALVSEAEGGEPMELPCEEDGSLLLSTLAAQFASASGLRYRAAARLRGLRLLDDRLRPPPDGWLAHRYFCAFPRASAAASPRASPPPAAARRCSDLVVLGLPWKTGEQAVRDYFSAFGELAMVQVKRDARTGLSKGFGFVKFTEYEAQQRALGRRHLIEGRWCDVRVPSRAGGEAGGGAASAARRKVFVGRCTEALSADDLREYFAAFGQVTDVFVPRPFRAFGFVTFLEPEVAQSLCGQDHVIRGVSVNVSTASPKRERGSGGGGPLLGWGLLEGGAPRLYNWACGVGDTWPGAGTASHASAPPPPLDSKPYLKYE